MKYVNLSEILYITRYFWQRLVIKCKMTVQAWDSFMRCSCGCVTLWGQWRWHISNLRFRKCCLPVSCFAAGCPWCIGGGKYTGTEKTFRKGGGETKSFHLLKFRTSKNIHYFNVLVQTQADTSLFAKHNRNDSRFGMSLTKSWCLPF